MIEIILVLQLILVVMFIMCLYAHNEIFKKESPNWMDKPLNQVSLSLSDDPSEIYGSNLDINSNKKTNDDKQKDSLEKDLKNATNEEKVSENAKQIQTNSNTTENIVKNGSEKAAPKNQTQGTVISMETIDNKNQQNTEQSDQKTTK